MPANEAPSTPSTWPLSGWQHELWILLGLPTPIPSQVYPKDGAHSGLEELSNVPWSPQLLGLEFAAPASFYTVTQATYYSTLRIEF